MTIKFDCTCKGQPINVIDNLKHELYAAIKKSSKAKTGKRIYVGITDSPKRRWYQHSKTKKWREMQVMYESTSIRNARLLERDLIDYARDKLANSVAGGGGKVGAGSKQYLYFLIR